MAGTIKHEWNGTILTITSDSGTSSADLKGEKGDDGARGAQGAPGGCYAEDSPKLGGVAASEYALKAQTAAKNYIDNYNFIINQRGSSQYTATGFGVDRWRFRSSNGGTMDILDNGVRINMGTSGISGLYQRIASTDYNSKFLELAGKPITLAIKIKENTFSTTGSNSGIDLICGAYLATEGSGSVVIARKSIPNGETGVFVATGTMPETMTNDNLLAVFRSPSSEGTGSVVVEWITLYEGTYTADTLPKPIRDDYAAELLECQRYYYVSNGQGYGYCTNASAARLNVPIPVEMRVLPSIDNENIKITCHNNGTNFDAATYSIAAMVGASIRINLTSDSKFTKFTPLAGYSSTNFGFSADL